MKRSWLLGLVALGALFSGTVSMAADRTVTVSGQGEVSAAPDMAIVRLGVEARGSDQKSTQREVEDTVRRFLNACNDLGIDKSDIKTSQLSIRPEYDWSKGNSRRLIGYYVRRPIEVKLKDLSKLGLLMAEATDVGVNQSQSQELKSSRKDELLREALALAAENAKLNAQTVAASLGAKVGKVRNISTTNVVFRPPPQMRAMAMESGPARGAKSNTFEVGEVSYSADVTVEFDLVVD